MAVIKNLIKISLKRKACFNSHWNGSLRSRNEAAGHMASTVKRREETSGAQVTSPSSFCNVSVVYTHACDNVGSGNARSLPIFPLPFLFEADSFCIESGAPVSESLTGPQASAFPCAGVTDTLYHTAAFTGALRV